MSPPAPKPRLLLSTMLWGLLCLGLAAISWLFLGLTARTHVVHITAYTLGLLVVWQLLRGLRWWTSPAVSPLESDAKDKTTPMVLPAEYRQLRSQIAVVHQDRRAFRRLLLPRLQRLLAQRQAACTPGTTEYAVVLHGEAAALWQEAPQEGRWHSRKVPLRCLADLFHQLEL